jgi:hypothetical protein
MNEIGADFVPFQVLRIFFSREADLLARSNQEAVLDFDVSVESAVNGVIFEQVFDLLWSAQIVNADDLKASSGVLGRKRQANDFTTNSSEAIDSDFDGL